MKTYLYMVRSVIPTCTGVTPVFLLNVEIPI